VSQINGGDHVRADSAGSGGKGTDPGGKGVTGIA
jgi:hypothetical protein